MASFFKKFQSKTNCFDYACLFFCTNEAFQNQLSCYKMLGLKRDSNNLANIVQKFQSKNILILLVCFSVKMRHLNPVEFFMTQWSKRESNNLANVVQKFQSKNVLIMLACLRQSNPYEVLEDSMVKKRD